MLCRQMGTDKRIMRQVIDTLVKDDRVESERAEDAVARALVKNPANRSDALQLYRAARRVLRIDPSDSIPPAGPDVLHTPVKPVRAPPPSRGTRRDTPVAKKTTR
jgi:hypothetical protein